MTTPSAGTARSWFDIVKLLGTRGSFLRLLAVSALIVIVFGALNPGVYLSGSNLQYIALATPELAILSLAIAIAMLTAGIDLSVVGIAKLSAIVAAQVLVASDGSPTWLLLGCAAGLATALGCGLVNGVLVARFNVPPILATLGTSQLFLGLALVISGGTVIKGLPSSFTDLALVTVAGIPLIFLIMLLLAGAVAVLVSRTALGFRMRLVGANPVAADYSGIRRQRVLVQAYVISGALAGVAGLIISARASGANSQYGLSYILLAIVVAVLAGVNPEGGYITVFGVVIAALAMQFLATGLLSQGVSSHLVNVAQGLLLIMMMLLSNRVVPWWSERRNRWRHQAPVSKDKAEVAA
jgi:simple sugar transport system permease protein